MSIWGGRSDSALVVLRVASALCQVGRTGRMRIVQRGGLGLRVRPLGVAARDVISLRELDRFIGGLARRVD